MHHIDKRGCLDELEEALTKDGESSLASFFDSFPDLLTELLETGSVTITIAEGSFVITLGAWESK